MCPKRLMQLRSPYSELYVTARLWADSKPLTVPVQTAYKVFKNARAWNEWLRLPIEYSAIPLNSQLAITVWDLSPAGGEDSRFHAIPFGGTTIPLFDKDNTLQKGRQRCRIHRNKAADGMSDTTTPYLLPSKRARRDGKVVEEQRDARAAEIERLEALMKKHEMGEIPENRWLDQLVFRQIEKLERGTFKSKLDVPRTDSGQENGDDDDGAADKVDDGVFYLYIEFPRFDHPIVFTDQEYPAPPVSTMQTASSSDIRLKPPPEVSLGPGINEEYEDPNIGRLVRIYDPEVGIRDNPAENKHRRLVRSHRTGALDRDLKPNAKIRDELYVIMSYGPTHELNPEERDLVWKFRHHLTRDKRVCVTHTSQLGLSLTYCRR
jgi:phosphatidylinositol 3-kinase